MKGMKTENISVETKVKNIGNPSQNTHNYKYILLKQYFGHRSFRNGQEELIDALLSGRDVLGIMPTGAGKSVCYQLPAMMINGITLVISPLISLMKDQVSALTQVGIPAAYINSSLSATQYQEVIRRAERNTYKIIYVAPERLTTASFLHFSQKVNISLIAVDEAHCVSQWGQDFRPDYLKIPEFINKLPRRPTVGAFTATATVQVKSDIVKLLLLQTPLCITTGFDRSNLYFEVVNPKSKSAFLLQYLEQRSKQSGIIYCSTRKSVESICENLCSHGILATRYHAGLTLEERKKNQEDFIHDRMRVMVATNAFGMGIDKSNVSFVVHYNMPKNLESYYQEAGRAGRDGEPAHCVLMFSGGDVQTAKFLIRNAEGNEELSAAERELILRQDMERLSRMIGYCKTNGCLRAYILEYFGESHSDKCYKCGNCNGQFVQVDITIPAQKILSAVARVERKYQYGLGITLIVRMLNGSKEQRVIQLGLDRLPTYGIMRDIGRLQIREYIDFMIDEGYLELTDGEYPVVRLTPAANDILFNSKPVLFYKRIRQSDTRNKRNKKSIGIENNEAATDGSLFTILKELRTKIAQKENVPAYVVFSNASLVDMATKKPRNISEFLQISGVGEVKAKRYGQLFLSAIENRMLEVKENE